MTWTASEAEDLARELAHELGSRWLHLEAVGQAAARLPLTDAEADIVVGSAWLHDIGYAPRLHRTGMHAIDGAVFLELLGAPRELVSLVAFHTGAEYEADERGLVDQLIQFDPPPQHLLDALTYADLITDVDGRSVTMQERLDGIFARYESQHPVHRAVTRSRSYLEACAGRAAARLGQPM
jgi:HD superfamily phosphodiesterase